jgi:hypothetical protein
MCHADVPERDGGFKKWKQCPYRVVDTLWHLENDADVYKQLEPYQDTYEELFQKYLCDGDTVARKRHPVFKIIRDFCKGLDLNAKDSNEVIEKFLTQKKRELDGDDSDTDSDTDSEDV